MNTESFSALRSDVLVAGTIHFRGYFTFDGQLRDGEIVGENLMVGATSVIEGNIDVTSLILHGTVTGEVIVKDHCELKGTASLTGKLTAPRLIMHEGAAMNAEIAVTREPKK